MKFRFKVMFRLVCLCLAFLVLLSGIVYADTVEFPTEHVNIKFNRTGNIYPKGEKIVFSLTEKNIMDSEITVIYSCGYILSEDEQCIKMGEKEVAFSENEEKKIVFELDNPGVYGIFKLKILKTANVNGTILNSEEYESEFSVSVSVADGESNPDYGINQHITEHNEGKIEVNNSLVPNAGIGMVRDGYSWEKVEKEKGVLEFDSKVKEKFIAIHNEGIDILFVCILGNKLYMDKVTDAPSSDEQIAAYARYCAFVAKELKGIVSNFEIWNEYNYVECNTTNEPPETYAKMLKAAYTAIKEVNPSANVVGVCCGGVYPNWVERIFKAGGYDYLDAVSLHPYEYTKIFDEEKLIRNVNSIRDLMKTYANGNPIKPLWYTEIGFSTYDSGFSEAAQAKNTVLSYAVSKAYNLADKYIQYQISDRDDPTESESCWGILRKTNSQIYVSSGAKPSYLAIAALNNFIGKNSEFKTVINDSRYYAFNFYNKKRDKNVLLVQSYQGEKSIKYSLGCDVVDVYDMYGNKIQRLSSKNGVYELAVGEMPQYIIGKFKSFEKTSIDSEMKDIPFSSAKTDFDGICNVGEYNIVLKNGSENSVADADLMLDCGALYVKLPRDAINEDEIRMSITYDDYVPSVGVKVKVLNSDEPDQILIEGESNNEGEFIFKTKGIRQTLISENFKDYSSMDEMYENGWQTGEWGSKGELVKTDAESYVELSKEKVGSVVSLKYTLDETENSGIIRIKNKVRFTSDARGVIELLPSTLIDNGNGTKQPLGATILSYSGGKLMTQLLDGRAFYNYIPNEWYDIITDVNMNTYTYDIQISKNGNVLGSYLDVPTEAQTYEEVLSEVSDISAVRYRCYDGGLDIGELTIEKIWGNPSEKIMVYDNFDDVTIDNAKYYGIVNPFGALTDEIASFVSPNEYTSGVVEVKGDKHIRKEFVPISKGKYKIRYNVLAGNGRIFAEINDDGNCSGDGGILLPYVEKGKVYYKDNTSNTPILMGSVKNGLFVTIEAVIDFEQKTITFSAWNADNGRKIGKSIKMDGIKEDKGKELDKVKFIHFLKWYDDYPGYIDNFKIERIADYPNISSDDIKLFDYKGNELERYDINSALGKITVALNYTPDKESFLDNITLLKTDDLSVVDTEWSFDNNTLCIRPKPILKKDSEYCLNISKSVRNVSGVELSKDFKFIFKTKGIRQTLISENFKDYSSIDEMYENGWQTGEWGSKGELVKTDAESYAELSKEKVGSVVSLKYTLDEIENSGIIRIKNKVRFTSDARGVIELLPSTLIDNGNGTKQPLGATILSYSGGKLRTQLLGGRAFYNFIPNEWYDIITDVNMNTCTYDIQISKNGNVLGSYLDVPTEAQTYEEVLSEVSDISAVRYRCYDGGLDIGELTIEKILDNPSEKTMVYDNFDDVTTDNAKYYGITAAFGGDLKSLVSFERPEGYDSKALAFNAFDKHVIKELVPISKGKYRISYKYKITGERMFIQLRKNNIHDAANIDSGNIVLPYSAINGNVYYYDNAISDVKKFGEARMGSWVTFNCDIDFENGKIIYSAKDSETDELIGEQIEQELIDTQGETVDKLKYFHLSSWGTAALYIDDFKIEYTSPTEPTNSIKESIRLESLSLNGERLNSLNQIKRGDTITVTSEIVNPSEEDKKLLWLVAYYKDGECIRACLEEDKALSGTGAIVTKNFKVEEEIKDANVLKIMLWDGTNKMTCYSKPITVKQ